MIADSYMLVCLHECQPQTLEIHTTCRARTAGSRPGARAHPVPGLELLRDRVRP